MNLRNESLFRLVPVAVLALVSCTGCSCIEQILPRCLTKDDVQAPKNLLPAHATLLKKTGALDFVGSHVDVVEYHNTSALNSLTGAAAGVYSYKNGGRIARVALKNRSGEEAVAVLVHLAAHLSGVAEVGRPYDHDTALAVEARFRRTIARRER
jgi:hypothetical protein